MAQVMSYGACQSCGGGIPVGRAVDASDSLGLALGASFFGLDEKAEICSECSAEIKDVGMVILEERLAPAICPHCYDRSELVSTSQPCHR